MKIALCVVATGKYKQFLCELLRTAREFFCAGHDVRFFVFSDIEGILPVYHDLATLVPTPHEPWPGPTLHRYRIMLRAEKELAEYDYIFYIDVDSRFVRPVGVEICGELVATVHPGYVEKPKNSWTFETRRRSRAFVHWLDAQWYVCGGFQGGAGARWIRAMKEMDAMIRDDEQRGIIPIYHDESIWNRYVVDNPPALFLSHEYMCPEQWRPASQKIVIVGKQTAEFHQ